jgi:ribosomal protein L37AE/L43A
MKCENCNSEMMQVGSFVFRCMKCNNDDNGGGMKIVVE